LQENIVHAITLFMNKFNVMNSPSLKLGVIFFEEEEHVVAYCPALDLYTQGKDLDDAKKMFENAVDIYLKEITESGTYKEVLLDLGWKMANAQSKELVPPEILGYYQQKFQVPFRK